MSDQKLPDNVERLLVTWQDTHYINFLSSDILCNMEEGERLSEAMTRDLPPKFVILDKSMSARSRAWSISLWVYFLPLGLFIAWCVWRWGPWGHPKAA